MRRRIGIRLAELSLYSGLTISAIAEVLGKTPNLIRRYELGTANIPAHILPKLAKIFDVPLEYFFEEYPKELDIPNFLRIKEYLREKNPDRFW